MKVRRWCGYLAHHHCKQQQQPTPLALNRRIQAPRLKNHRRKDLRLVRGQKTSCSERSELPKRMYPKDGETDYEAPEARRIVRKAGKKENERAFIFKKLVFRLFRKLKRQGTVNKSY